MKPVNGQSRTSRHDAVAPYWAMGLIVLCITGISTIWLDLGSFWKGYVLDMTGPAWCYILIRIRYTEEKNNRWTRFFTPQKSVIVCLAACFCIEGMQFFKIYDSTFDPWDILAYVSILVPLFILDMVLLRKG